MTIFKVLLFPVFYISKTPHWPSIWSGRGSGYLCQGIVGGALIPLVQGVAADAWSLQWSFLIPAACYFYIGWYALVGSKVKE